MLVCAWCVRQTRDAAKERYRPRARVDCGGKSEKEERERETSRHRTSWGYKSTVPNKLWMIYSSCAFDICTRISRSSFSTSLFPSRFSVRNKSRICSLLTRMYVHEWVYRDCDRVWQLDYWVAGTQERTIWTILTDYKNGGSSYFFFLTLSAFRAMFRRVIVVLSLRVLDSEVSTCPGFHHNRNILSEFFPHYIID